MDDRWIYVRLPYACFALRITDGRVAEAPPIARWAVGKPQHVAADLLRKRGATFADLPLTTRSTP